ncbi:hypothetical protein FRC09_007699 [Ceratobasidium sp. 395]|nr:hypothetical protein FRC09_007699 [Ceratobasidium sp. 395]
MSHQRRPSASNLPPSSAVHAAIMASAAGASAYQTNKSNSTSLYHCLFTPSALKPCYEDTGRTQAEPAAAKPVSKYAEVDPQMFIDSPFVGGATLSPMTSTESTSPQSGNKNKTTGSSFSVRYFNPSSDPRLLAM